jgi:hypothetical protein
MPEDVLIVVLAIMVAFMIWAILLASGITVYLE